MKSLILILSLFFIGAFSAPYDPTLARELLRASTASYCTPQTLQTMLCGDACNEMGQYAFNRHFQSNLSSSESVSYSTFVSTATKRVTIAFRGTQGKYQLLKEAINGRAMTYDLHYVPNSLATEYFFIKYRDNLRYDFLYTVRTLAQRYPDFQFYFTGHSLGGAFAAHAALDVSYLGIVPRERLSLYTFGCPRVGDYNLAQAIYNAVSESYRVVHNHDIVPHLPPCITDFAGGCTANPNHINQNGFLVWNTYHSGIEVFYSNDAYPTSYRICSRFEDPTCSKQYGMFSLGPTDHLTYLGVSTSCLV